MTPSAARFPVLALAGWLLACLAAPAQAFDPTGNPVADALLGTLEAAGGRDLRVGTIEDDGASVVVSDFAATLDLDGETTEVAAAALAFSNPVVGPDGRLAADAIAVEGLSVTAGESVVAASRAALTTVLFADPEALKARDSAPAELFGYRRAEFTGITIASEGEGSVPVRRMVSELDDFVDGLPRKGRFEVEGIEIASDEIEDEQARETLQSLGYETLTLSMTASGAWDEENARAVLDPLEISGEGIGRLTIEATLGGVTREIVEDLKRSTPGGGGEAAAALQTLTLEGLNLRFDNDTLADRLIDRQAAEANLDRDTFVDRLSQSLPQILALIGSPDFEAELAATLQSFLEEPESLEISAEPPQPLDMNQLIGAFVVNRAMLPALLGLEVTANE